MNRRTSHSILHLFSRVGLLAISLALLGFSVFAYGEVGPPTAEDMARTLWTRVTGAPIFRDDPRYARLVELVQENRMLEAAQMATADPNFIMQTMNAWSTAFTNPEGDPSMGYTDYNVTMMLTAHYGRPFHEVLWEDVVYMARTDVIEKIMKIDGRERLPNYDADCKVISGSVANPMHNKFDFDPAFQPSVKPNRCNKDFDGVRYRLSTLNNSHYSNPITSKDLYVPISGNSYTLPHYPPGDIYDAGDGRKFFRQRITFVGYYTDPTTRQRVNHVEGFSQTTMAQRPSTERVDAHNIAGILSGRQFAAVNYDAGTNRRAVQNIAKDWMCTELEQIKDTRASDYYIRKDVDRQATGTSMVFNTDCRGCHSFMDSWGRAFCRFSFDGNRARYSPNGLYNKCTDGSQPGNGETFPGGWPHPGDEVAESFDTMFTGNPLGLRGPTSGFGLKAFGQMIGQSRAFSTCMAKKVFAYTCNRDHVAQEIETINRLADIFEENDYNIKSLFEHAAIEKNCLPMK